jgi:hypothetical protein
MSSVLPSRPEARRLLLGTYLSALGTGMTLPFLYIYLHEVRGIDSTLVGLVSAWMGLLSLLRGLRGRLVVAGAPAVAGLRRRLADGLRRLGRVLGHEHAAGHGHG